MRNQMLATSRSCAKCTSTDLVTVTLTIKDEPVAFDHCRRCEHRSWHANGNQVALAEVLERVSS